MKTLLTLLLFLVATGCATTHDPRLNGSWQSNREATGAEALRQDPRWKDASPEKFEQFGNVFGHVILTYANSHVTMRYKDDIGTFHYNVVERGDDYVVIRTDGVLSGDREYRIEFEEDLSSYWIDSGWGIPERFDKLEIEPQRAPAANPGERAAGVETESLKAGRVRVSE